MEASQMWNDNQISDWRDGAKRDTGVELKRTELFPKRDINIQF